MSKKHNKKSDNQEPTNHDEMKEITENEISEINEVTHHTHETHPAHTAMDSVEFETKLTEFFTKHKPSKIRLVSRLLKQFKGNENFVLEHLHNKYVLRLEAGKQNKISGNKTDAHGNFNNDHGNTNDLEASTDKPKSKKKLIIIVSAIVIVLLAVGGFLMKDKLMGSGHVADAAHSADATEHGDAKTDVANGAHSAEAKPKEVEAATTTTVDSAKSVVADSATTN